MITFKSFVRSALFIVSVLTVCACANNDIGPTPQDFQYEELSKTWNAVTVTLDDEVLPDYEYFTLNLNTPYGSTYQYAVTGQPFLSPWPSSGLWKFGDDFMTSLIRDPGTVDELSMTYVLSADGELLTVDFYFNGEGYSTGRTTSATGQWHFEFR